MSGALCEAAIPRRSLVENNREGAARHPRAALGFYRATCPLCVAQVRESRRSTASSPAGVKVFVVRNQANTAALAAMRRADAVPDRPRQSCTEVGIRSASVSRPARALGTTPTSRARPSSYRQGRADPLLRPHHNYRVRRSRLMPCWTGSRSPTLTSRRPEPRRRRARHNRPARAGSREPALATTVGKAMPERGW